MNDRIGIGIDFGTTNSVVCAYDSSIKTFVPFLNNEGLPHPSVVWYRADGQTPRVGYESKLQMRGYSGTEGHHFEASIKRHLGKNYEQDVFGRKLRSYEIAAEVFKFLKDDALRQRRDLDIREAVVTIPVYFDGLARRDLRKAADEAGIFIKTFIHEPFSAIVGHLNRRIAWNQNSPFEEKTYLVFDWGGGTLDITVAKVSDNKIIELAVGGVNDRAGDFFDEQIERFSLSKSCHRNNVKLDEIRILPGDRGRLITECERAKIGLSHSLSEQVQTGRAYSLGPTRFAVDETIDRRELDEIVSLDIEHALEQVEATVRRAGISPHVIDEALLIGGTSKIPAVHHRLRDLFGHRITEVERADTIIAEGAAVIDAMGFQPMLSRSICVELADDSLYPVFSEGSLAVPELCKKTLNFYCTDNRDGEAKLIIKDRTRGSSPSKALLKQILTIPVSSELPHPYNHERVTVDVWLDEDLIVNVHGSAATQRIATSCEIHDICFGLRLHNQ